MSSSWLINDDLCHLQMENSSEPDREAEMLLIPSWYYLGKKNEFGLLFSREGTKNTFFPFCGPPPALIVHRWFLLRGILWHSWSLFLYWVIITDDLGTKIGQERSSVCVSGSGNADQRLSLPLNVKCVFTYVCMCMCETGDREEEEVENVSVNLSGQQLINEVLEMFYCMNTLAHTHTHTCSQFL